MKLKSFFDVDAWDIFFARSFKSLKTRMFFRTYFYNGKWGAKWLGEEVWKQPLDLWLYQEIICERKPDVILEFGTWKGKSAKFFGDICQMIGHGEVITVDVNPCDMEHPLVTKIVDERGSADPEVIKKVHDLVNGRTCLMILDSLHRAYHVLEELRGYNDLCHVDWHIIVEDTIVAGNPVVPSWKKEYGCGGPLEAVDKFLKECDGKFVRDRSAEKYMIHWARKGFLKRVK